MTLTSPMGPSVYVIFLLIDPFAFPPIARAEDADGAFPIRKPDSENAFAYASETEEARFMLAVRNILRNHAHGISECVLRKTKGDTMLFTVLPVFVSIPLEFTIHHDHTITACVILGNIIIWLFIFIYY